MKGWHKESYRHYLAGKGIKTSYYNSKAPTSHLNYYMAATKTVSIDKPFDIYEHDMPWGKMEHRVLKKYQDDDDKPHARWLVAGKSAATGGTWEMGDVYVEEVKQGRKLSPEEVKERIKEDSGPDYFKKK